MKLEASGRPLSLVTMAIFLLTCGATAALGGCGGSTTSIGGASEADGGHGGSSSNAASNGGGASDTSCAVAGGVVIGGCDAGASSTSPCPAGESCDTSTSANGTSGGCTVTSLGCATGATGYSCQPDADPGSDGPTLICSSATTQGAVYDYCCREWPSGNGCVRDPGFPCGFNAYALRCMSGSLPANIDPNLQCGNNFSQSNGDNEFCCTGL